MSDSFNPGDLAVCINDDICPISKLGSGYRKGRIYRVALVKSGQDNFGRDATGLKAVGLEHEVYRNVICFKKLPPASDAFTKAMRACRPTKIGEPA